MNKVFLKLRQSGAPKSGNFKIVYNVKQILGEEEGTPGYFKRDELRSFLESLRETEADDLTQLFDHVRNNEKIIGMLRRRIDKSGRVYKYPHILLPNSQPGMKVILEAGMDNFLTDYMYGKIAISFTLEELVDELLNQGPTQQ